MAMKLKVLSGTCAFVFVTMCVGCSLPAHKAEREVESLPNDELVTVFNRGELETRSWESPNGFVYRYLSQHTLHVENKRDIVLFFYGTRNEPNCVDIYFLFGDNAYVLIGHDTLGGNIVDYRLEVQGKRKIIRFVRIEAGSNKRMDYAYELLPSNTLTRTISTFISNTR